MRGYPKSPRSHSDRRRQLCGQHLCVMPRPDATPSRERSQSKSSWGRFEKKLVFLAFSRTEKIINKQKGIYMVFCKKIELEVNNLEV